MSARVQVIGYTRFDPPDDVAWTTDADGGQALAEFAGRACYESWDKPVRATATNAGYLRHLLEVGHLSALEHATVTVYLRGISGAAAHELMRHRHFSYSQLSPRHAPTAVVEPTLVAGDAELRDRFRAASEASLAAYADLLAALEARHAPTPEATLRRKQARQAARALLPGGTETRLVMTGNLRAWRHLVAVRGSEHADVELRALALGCLRELRAVAPHAFADFEVVRLPDGTEVAASPLAGEG